MAQVSMNDGKPYEDHRSLQVETVRGWREVARDVFYDTALAVLWLATLWMLIMDVVAS